LKDTSSNNICIVFSTREDYSHVFVLSNEKALSTKVSNGAIYAKNKTSNKNNLLILIIVCLLTVLLSAFFFYYKKKKKNLKLNKVKFFHKENGLFYFQNQLLEENFELLEIMLLKKFLEQPSQILELSLTLGIFEFDEASQETAKKRREINLKSICEKIAQKSDLAQKDIFIETRNPIDKRIKLLQLNQSLVDSSINEIS
jgi:LPXTG-motif cell wall-anchored protein